MKKQKSVEMLMAEYREQLGEISKGLSNRIFPLSNLPEKLHHQQIAHAVEAVDLARGILRDVKPYEN
jgi:hypothetical protein